MIKINDTLRNIQAQEQNEQNQAGQNQNPRQQPRFARAQQQLTAQEVTSGDFRQAVSYWRPKPEVTNLHDRQRDWEKGFKQSDEASRRDQHIAAALRKKSPRDN